MLSNAFSLAAVAVALFPAALALGPNLVLNPSFEVNGLSQPATVTPADMFTFPPWNNPLTSNAFVFTGSPQPSPPAQSGYTADGGVYTATFGSTNAPGDTFFQSGLATTAGACYSVSFQASLDGISNPDRTQITTAFSFDNSGTIDVTTELQAPIIAANPPTGDPNNPFPNGAPGVYQTVVRLLPALNGAGSTITFNGFSAFGYSTIDAVQVALSATGVFNPATGTCACPPGFTLSATTLDCALTASAGGGVRARRSRSRRHNEVQW